MFNLNVETGKTVKFGKNYRSELSKLQTFVADTLKMQRGKVSVKEHAKEINVKVEKATRRLDTHDYKRAMKIKEQEQKLVIASAKYNFREFQKKITALENLTNEQKRELHQLNSKVKNKNAEVQELNEQIAELEARVPVEVKVPVENPINAKLQEEADQYKAKAKKRKEKFEELQTKIKKLETEVYSEARYENKTLVKYKDLSIHLQKEIEKLEKVKDTDTKKINKLEDKEKIIIDDIKELSKNILQKDISKRNEVEEAKKVAKELHKTIKQHKTSIDTLKSDLSSYKQDIAQLQAQNKELKEEISYLRSMHEKNSNDDDWREALSDLEKQKLKQEDYKL